MSVVTFELLRTRLGQRAPRRLADPMAAQAAVALILAPRTDREVEALFIRRAEMPGDPWSGQMALPGGRRDPEDVDLLATAVRETLEETGIVLPVEAQLGVLDDFMPVTRLLPRIVVQPYVFGLPEPPAVTLSAEVAQHLWVPLNELRQAYSTAEVDIRGARVQVPAFVIGQNVIWGLTERIVSPFIELYAGS